MVERRPGRQSFRPSLLLSEKTDQRPGLLRSQLSILLPAQTGAEVRSDLPDGIGRRGDRLVCRFERNRIPQHCAQGIGRELEFAGCRLRYPRRIYIDRRVVAGGDLLPDDVDDYRLHQLDLRQVQPRRLLVTASHQPAAEDLRVRRRARRILVRDSLDRALARGERRKRSLLRVLIKLAAKEGGVTFAARVQPRAAKSGVAGELDGVLKIRLAAPPVEGEANEELIRLLAKLFAAPRRRISILSGQTSKNKVISVSGISVDEAARVLAEALDQYRER
ncbi:MAG: DUF167 domain-containing protein [Blastocatellia bacterium]|nr:DUF167 domain-containing protein [Blastocatellia bacterium]